MPTRNVNLTDVLARMIDERVRSGRYESASEVVRAGLRALELREEEDDAKMAWLKQAIAEGDASGVDKDFSLERVLEQAGLRRPAAKPKRTRKRPPRAAAKRR